MLDLNDINITHDIILLDLTKFRSIAGKLITDHDIELDLIKSFRLCYNDDSCGLAEFTNNVLKHIYKDNINRSSHEINNFFNEERYYSIVLYFIETLECYILGKIDPLVIDIYFNKYVETSDNLIAEFTVVKNGRKIS